MATHEVDSLLARYRFACSLAESGGKLAYEFYLQRDSLLTEHKGNDLQDVVSRADCEVESYVKSRIAEAFPGDGFLGEESGTMDAQQRVLWVVDPIDGTSCFP
ncbi:inositol monophosphatase family protein, partial [Pantoea endophytica]